MNDASKLTEEERAQAQAAQARVYEKRWRTGASGRASPRQDQNQSAKADPLAGVCEAGKRWVKEHSPEQQARICKNITQNPPGPEHTGGTVQNVLGKMLATTRQAENATAELEKDTPAQAEETHSPHSATEVHEILFALSPKDKEKHARIPRDLMTTGAYNALNGNETRTLIALFCYSSTEDGISRPGYEHLLRRLGKPDAPNNRRQIGRAIQKLISRGLLWRKSAAYPRHAAEYFLARNQQHIDFILSMNGGRGLSPKMEDSDCPPLGEGT